MGKHSKKKNADRPSNENGHQLVVLPGSRDGSIKFRTVDRKDLEISPDGDCRLSGAGNRGGQRIVLDDEMKQVVIAALQGDAKTDRPDPTIADVREAIDDHGRPIIQDRPAGPNDVELESGLIKGRWYSGAPQDCENHCFNCPEGQHVPPCPLNTSKRAPVETPDPYEVETEMVADV